MNEIENFLHFLDKSILHPNRYATNDLDRVLNVDEGSCYTYKNLDEKLVHYNFSLKKFKNLDPAKHNLLFIKDCINCFVAQNDDDNLSAEFYFHLIYGPLFNDILKSLESQIEYKIQHGDSIDNSTMFSIAIPNNDNMIINIVNNVDLELTQVIQQWNDALQNSDGERATINLTASQLNTLVRNFRKATINIKKLDDFKKVFEEKFGIPSDYKYKIGRLAQDNDDVRLKLLSCFQHNNPENQETYIKLIEDVVYNRLTPDKYRQYLNDIFQLPDLELVREDIIEEYKEQYKRTKAQYIDYLVDRFQKEPDKVLQFSESYLDQYALNTANFNVVRNEIRNQKDVEQEFQNFEKNYIISLGIQKFINTTPELKGNTNTDFVMQKINEKLSSKAGEAELQRLGEEIYNSYTAQEKLGVMYFFEKLFYNEKGEFRLHYTDDGALIHDRITPQSLLLLDTFKLALKSSQTHKSIPNMIDNLYMDYTGKIDTDALNKIALDCYIKSRKDLDLGLFGTQFGNFKNESVIDFSISNPYLSFLFSEYLNNFEYNIKDHSETQKIVKQLKKYEQLFVKLPFMFNEASQFNILTLMGIVGGCDYRHLKNEMYSLYGIKEPTSQDVQKLQSILDTLNKEPEKGREFLFIFNTLLNNDVFRKNIVENDAEQQAEIYKIFNNLYHNLYETDNPSNKALLERFRKLYQIFSSEAEDNIGTIKYKEKDKCQKADLTNLNKHYDRIILNNLFGVDTFVLGDNVEELKVRTKLLPKNGDVVTDMDLGSVFAQFTDNDDVNYVRDKDYLLEVWNSQDVFLPTAGYKNKFDKVEFSKIMASSASEKTEEEERKRKEEERQRQEAERKRAAEEARKKLETKRKMVQEARRKLEAERKRAAEEAERQRQEEEIRKAEEERKKKEEEAKKAAEEANKLIAEANEKRKQEEEIKKRNIDSKIERENIELRTKELNELKEEQKRLESEITKLEKEKESLEQEGIKTENEKEEIEVKIQNLELEQEKLESKIKKQESDYKLIKEKNINKKLKTERELLKQREVLKIQERINKTKIEDNIDDAIKKCKLDLADKALDKQRDADKNSYVIKNINGKPIILGGGYAKSYFIHFIDFLTYDTELNERDLDDNDLNKIKKLQSFVMQMTSTEPENYIYYLQLLQDNFILEGNNIVFDSKKYTFDDKRFKVPMRILMLFKHFFANYENHIKSHEEQLLAKKFGVNLSDFLYNQRLLNLYVSSDTMIKNTPKMSTEENEDDIGYANKETFLQEYNNIISNSNFPINDNLLYSIAVSIYENKLYRQRGANLYYSGKNIKYFNYFKDILTFSVDKYLDKNPNLSKSDYQYLAKIKALQNLVYSIATLMKNGQKTDPFQLFSSVKDIFSEYEGGDIFELYAESSDANTLFLVSFYGEIINSSKYQNIIESIFQDDSTHLLSDLVINFIEKVSRENIDEKMVMNADCAISAEDGETVKNLEKFESLSEEEFNKYKEEQKKRALNSQQERTEAYNLTIMAENEAKNNIQLKTHLQEIEEQLQKLKEEKQIKENEQAKIDKQLEHKEKYGYIDGGRYECEYTLKFRDKEIKLDVSKNPDTDSTWFSFEKDGYTYDAFHISYENHYGYTIPVIEINLDFLNIPGLSGIFRYDEKSNEIQNKNGYLGYDGKQSFDEIKKNADIFVLYSVLSDIIPIVKNICHASVPGLVARELQRINKEEQDLKDLYQKQKELLEKSDLKIKNLSSEAEAKIKKAIDMEYDEKINMAKSGKKNIKQLEKEIKENKLIQEKNEKIKQQEEDKKLKVDGIIEKIQNKIKDLQEQIKIAKDKASNTNVKIQTLSETLDKVLELDRDIKTAEREREMAEKRAEEARKWVEKAKREAGEAKKATEEAERQRQEAERQREEAERKKREEEAKKAAEEEKRRKEEEARRKLEEEIKKAEAERKRAAEARRKLEEEHKRKEEDKVRKRQEEEIRKAEEERKKKEEEARRVVEEAKKAEESRRLAAKEVERLMAEIKKIEEAKRKEEEAKKRKEEEERKAAEEAERKRQEANERVKIEKAKERQRLSDQQRLKAHPFSVTHAQDEDERKILEIFGFCARIAEEFGKMKDDSSKKSKLAFNIYQLSGIRLSDDDMSMVNTIIDMITKDNIIDIESLRKNKKNIYDYLFKDDKTTSSFNTLYSASFKLNHYGEGLYKPSNVDNVDNKIFSLTGLTKEQILSLEPDNNIPGEANKNDFIYWGLWNGLYSYLTDTICNSDLYGKDSNEKIKKLSKQNIRDYIINLFKYSREKYKIKESIDITKLDSAEINIIEKDIDLLLKTIGINNEYLSPKEIYNILSKRDNFKKVSGEFSKLHENTQNLLTHSGFVNICHNRRLEILSTTLYTNLINMLKQIVDNNKYGNQAIPNLMTELEKLLPPLPAEDQNPWLDNPLAMKAIVRTTLKSLGFHNKQLHNMQVKDILKVLNQTSFESFSTQVVKNLQLLEYINGDGIPVSVGNAGSTLIPLITSSVKSFLANMDKEHKQPIEESKYQLPMNLLFSDFLQKRYDKIQEEKLQKELARKQELEKRQQKMVYDAAQKFKEKIIDLKNGRYYKYFDSEIDKFKIQDKEIYEIRLERCDKEGNLIKSSKQIKLLCSFFKEKPSLVQLGYEEDEKHYHLYQQNPLENGLHEDFVEMINRLLEENETVETIRDVMRDSVLRRRRQLREQQEEAERIAREKAEAEKAEAERLEREKNEAERIAREKAEAEKKAAEDTLRKEAEAARRKLEEETRKTEIAGKAAEEAIKLEEEIKKAEAARKAVEETKRKIGEATKKVMEEARKKAEEARKIKEEEEKKRKEEEARKIKEEEKKKKEDEAKIKLEEEIKKTEAARKAVEEAARKAVEETARKAAEETKRKIEEATKKVVEEARKKAEEEARKKAEEEAIKLIEEENRKLAEQIKQNDILRDIKIKKMKEEYERKRKELLKKAEDEIKAKVEEEIKKMQKKDEEIPEDKNSEEGDEQIKQDEEIIKQLDEQILSMQKEFEENNNQLAIMQNTLQNYELEKQKLLQQRNTQNQTLHKIINQLKESKKLLQKHEEQNTSLDKENIKKKKKIIDNIKETEHALQEITAKLKKNNEEIQTIIQNIKQNVDKNLLEKLELDIEKSQSVLQEKIERLNELTKRIKLEDNHNKSSNIDPKLTIKNDEQVVYYPVFNKKTHSVILKNVKKKGNSELEYSDIQLDEDEMAMSHQFGKKNKIINFNANNIFEQLNSYQYGIQMIDSHGKISPVDDIASYQYKMNMIIDKFQNKEFEILKEYGIDLSNYSEKMVLAYDENTDSLKFIPENNKLKINEKLLYYNLPDRRGYDKVRYPSNILRELNRFLSQANNYGDRFDVEDDRGYGVNPDKERIRKKILAKYKELQKKLVDAYDDVLQEETPTHIIKKDIIYKKQKYFVVFQSGFVGFKFIPYEEKYMQDIDGIHDEYVVYANKRSKEPLLLDCDQVLDFRELLSANMDDIDLRRAPIRTNIRGIKFSEDDEERKKYHKNRFMNAINDLKFDIWYFNKINFGVDDDKRENPDIYMVYDTKKKKIFFRNRNKFELGENEQTIIDENSKPVYLSGNYMYDLYNNVLKNSNKLKLRDKNGNISNFEYSEMHSRLRLFKDNTLGPLGVLHRPEIDRVEELVIESTPDGEVVMDRKYRDKMLKLEAERLNQEIKKDKAQIQQKQDELTAIQNGTSTILSDQQSREILNKNKQLQEKQNELIQIQEYEKLLEEKLKKQQNQLKELEKQSIYNKQQKEELDKRVKYLQEQNIKLEKQLESINSEISIKADMISNIEQDIKKQQMSNGLMETKIKNALSEKTKLLKEVSIKKKEREAELAQRKAEREKLLEAERLKHEEQRKKIENTIRTQILKLKQKELLNEKEKMEKAIQAIQQKQKEDKDTILEQQKLLEQKKLIEEKKRLEEIKKAEAKKRAQEEMIKKVIKQVNESTESRARQAALDKKKEKKLSPADIFMQQQLYGNIKNTVLNRDKDKNDDYSLSSIMSQMSQVRAPVKKHKKNKVKDPVSVLEHSNGEQTLQLQEDSPFHVDQHLLSMLNIKLDEKPSTSRPSSSTPSTSSSIPSTSSSIPSTSSSIPSSSIPSSSSIPPMSSSIPSASASIPPMSSSIPSSSASIPSTSAPPMSSSIPISTNTLLQPEDSNNESQTTPEYNSVNLEEEDRKNISKILSNIFISNMSNVPTEFLHNSNEKNKILDIKPEKDKNNDNIPIPLGEKDKSREKPSEIHNDDSVHNTSDNEGDSNFNQLEQEMNGINYQPSDLLKSLAGIFIDHTPLASDIIKIELNTDASENDSLGDKTKEKLLENSNELSTTKTEETVDEATTRTPGTSSTVATKKPKGSNDDDFTPIKINMAKDEDKSDKIIHKMKQEDI